MAMSPFPPPSLNPTPSSLASPGTMGSGTDARTGRRLPAALRESASVRPSLPPPPGCDARNGARDGSPVQCFRKAPLSTTRAGS